jgi:hypothetical protein
LIVVAIFIAAGSHFYLFIYFLNIFNGWNKLDIFWFDCIFAGEIDRLLNLEISFVWGCVNSIILIWTLQFHASNAKRQNILLIKITLFLCVLSVACVFLINARRAFLFLLGLTTWKCFEFVCKVPGRPELLRIK